MALTPPLIAPRGPELMKRDTSNFNTRINATTDTPFITHEPNQWSLNSRKLTAAISPLCQKQLQQYTMYAKGADTPAQKTSLEQAHGAFSFEHEPPRR